MTLKWYSISKVTYEYFPILRNLWQNETMVIDIHIAGIYRYIRSIIMGKNQPEWNKFMYKVL